MTDVRLKSGDCDEHLLVAERDLRAWYEVVRRLPAAYDCDATLVVLPQEIEYEDGRVGLGAYHGPANVISVAIMPNPYDTIGTLIHEVAHAATNPRHRRHHGYSWRRQYSELVEAIVGYPTLPLASDYRRRAHAEYDVRPNRAAALDMMCVVALTEARAHVRITPGRVTVVAGKRRISANVQIPLGTCIA